MGVSALGVCGLSSEDSPRDPRDARQYCAICARGLDPPLLSPCLPTLPDCAHRLLRDGDPCAPNLQSRVKQFVSVRFLVIISPPQNVRDRSRSTSRLTEAQREGVSGLRHGSRGRDRGDGQSGAQGRERKVGGAKASPRDATKDAARATAATVVREATPHDRVGEDG